MKLGIRRSVLVLLLLLLISALSATRSPSEDDPKFVNLTILHTNDLHGRIFPFSYPTPRSSTVAEARLGEIRDIGGLARIASIVRSIRAEPGHETLLLDAGDLFGTTPLAVHYKNRAMIEIYNAIGYDAMTIGEWDMKMSPEDFDAFVDAASFPILCANIKSLETGDPLFESTKIVQLGPIRVGLFGLTGHFGQPERAIQDRAEIEIPLFAAERIVPELKAAGVDLIVGISHFGVSGDGSIASGVKGIDVIIGGHSHQRLEEPRIVTDDRPGSPETVIAQTYKWGGELGRLDLAFVHREEGGYQLIGHEHSLIPITSEIPEDPEVAAVIDSLYEPLRLELDEALGRAEGDFENVGLERATIHLVTDAMREATGAQVALVPYSEVRESIFEGSVRMYDLDMVIPYDDSLVLMEMTGDRLRQALANPRDFLGFSGIRVVWADRKPVTIVMGNKPLDEKELLTVVVPARLHQKLFSNVEMAWNADVSFRDAVAQSIRSLGTIRPVLDGRTVDIEEE